ncbi:MAG: hypothetical protein JNJ77_16025 [Planctomycetia bacterium]|nr:hypothetical protein [Planctomycetia bacterium]
MAAPQPKSSPVKSGTVTPLPPSSSNLAHSESDSGSAPLTPELLTSYNQSHYRLLLWLCVLMAFVLSCFPISDPDIFFSLQTGRLIVSPEAGENSQPTNFPWGKDPYGYAEGIDAPWYHTGWLGDVIIYLLYQTGGGPLLVLVRALLVAWLVWLIMNSGSQSVPRFWTVLAVFLGVLVLSQRLYFRTELFSLVLLGVTLVALTKQPGNRLAALHRLTANRWYWILPILFLLWVNLDGWFFLGLAVVIIWCIGSWLQQSTVGKAQCKALTIATLLSLAACCVSPFHIHAFLQIPTWLYPPTATELHNRFVEQKANNPKLRMAEQLRLFTSPWDNEFFDHVRADTLNSIANEAPLLPAFYPKSLSLSEWAYYPFFILILASLFMLRGRWSWASCLVALLFVILGAWQSRLAGFLAVAGMTLAVLHFQGGALPTPWMNRLAILGKQLLCLVLGLAIQIICLLHLIPTPDVSPSSLGHIHPRGAFGLAFRSDSAIQQACEKLELWRRTYQLAGRPFHYDWTDVVGYDIWYNPGSRHFLDRRHEVHTTATVSDFLAANDAIAGVLSDPLKPDGSNLSKVFSRQELWQGIFKKYDISYLIVKKRGFQNELTRALLSERDRNNLPVWKPLQLQNGQLFALAWTGSQHWTKLQALEYVPGNQVFRQNTTSTSKAETKAPFGTLSHFLLGDASRRPAALDESAWHIYYTQSEMSELIGNELARIESLFSIVGNLGLRIANPINMLPPIQVWFSNRQRSASPLFLSLQSARQAMADLPADATLFQRAEVWTQYLQAISLMTQYEQEYTPLAARYREPLQLFALRQTALATLEARLPSSILTNLQLARAYRSAGALDAALEHCLYLRTLVTRQRPDDAEGLYRRLSDDCKKEFGFSPLELEKEVQQQQTGWQKAVHESGWAPRDGNLEKDVLNRAGMAMRLGLPQLALQELIQSGVKNAEAAVLACQIYFMLGQHDVVLEEFLNRSPEIVKALGPSEYHYRVCLGEWCLGRPEKAAEHRIALAKFMNDSALQSGLNAGMVSLYGTSTQSVGSMLGGSMLAQQSASDSLGIADQQVAAGLLLLEAGKPLLAAKYFEQAISQTDPNTPWRPLIERYYQQITGSNLK